MTIIKDEKYQNRYERGRVEIIENLLPSVDARLPALDLGSGSGFFSRILTDKGWEVTAVDMEADNIAASREFVHRGVVGSLPDVLDTLQDQRFSLVVLLEVIEHLDPSVVVPLLEKIWGLTARGSHLLASTPNYRSVEGLGGYYWGQKIRGWGEWKAWDTTHIKIYSATEFLRLLRAQGWRVKEAVGYWYEGGLPLGVRLRLPLKSSRRLPLNRFGFNTITLCEKP